MDEETSQMLIGRRMRCAEDLGEAATPEETEALVRKTRTEMEAEFRAQDRWIELGRPGPNFWVWREEMKRRERWRWLSRVGWNLAAFLGVAVWLVILIPNALAVLATAGAIMTLFGGMVLCGAVIMVPVAVMMWLLGKWRRSSGQ